MEYLDDNAEMPSVQQFPSKQTPVGDLEETLTSFVHDQLLPARYLRPRNPESDELESPSALFTRVAQNTALAEAAYATSDEKSEIPVTPAAIPDGVNDREQLVATIFGDEETASLTPENIHAFSYRQLVPSLPRDVRSTVARTAAEFERSMTSLQFIPNSPALSNAGTDVQQLASCFALEPAGDIEAIMETLARSAQIIKYGGGVGYSLDSLPVFLEADSPPGDVTAPVRVLELYNRVPTSIEQSGTRRGAQIGTLSIEHPAVIDFVRAKHPLENLQSALGNGTPTTALEVPLSDGQSGADPAIPSHLRNVSEHRLSNFNLSVSVTDEFMDAVATDSLFTLRDPQGTDPYQTTPAVAQLYRQYGFDTHVTVGEPLVVPARQLWTHIIECAHATGEPGLLFETRLQEDHSIPQSGPSDLDICTTDPCGVQPLTPAEACPLGHINLSLICQEGRSDIDRNVDAESSDSAAIASLLDTAVDWERLDRQIRLGVRFLDNAITMSRFPLPAVTDRTRQLRKIGLGVMGLAHFLTQLGLRYGSPAANQATTALLRYITHEATAVSHKLAKERGTFEAWAASKYATPQQYPNWFRTHTGEDPADWPDGYPVRNHKVTGVAPCGATSMIGRTTGGCEPPFDLVYKRTVEDISHTNSPIVLDDYIRQILSANNIDPEAVRTEAAEKFASGNACSVESLSSVPDGIAEIFVTARELEPSTHVSVQCACQRGVDAAVSKTCNLSEDATPSDVAEAFWSAYENGVKGLTVYVNGSRATQVLQAAER